MTDLFANSPASVPSLLSQQGARIDLSDLSREVALLLDLDDAAALQRGAWIGGEKVFLLYDEELDEGVHILIDVGGIAPGDEASEVLRVLMEVNPELSPAKGESFGLDAQSGRILFRAFFPDGEFSPHTVAREIAGYVSLMHELREGPLSGLSRNSIEVRG